MSKPTALFLLALLLFFSLSSAARPTPKTPAVEASPKVKGVVEEGEQVEEINCQGIDEEECLMRRSLNAHLDYIYTQNHKP